MTDELESYMATFTPEQLQEKMDSGKFWLVESLSADWLVVLSRLMRDYYTDESDKLKGELYVVIGDFSVLVMMEKSVLPAAALAERLGVTEEEINSTDLIKLWPLEGSAPVKTPTVPYTGKA